MIDCYEIFVTTIKNPFAYLVQTQIRFLSTFNELRKKKFWVHLFRTGIKFEAMLFSVVDKRKEQSFFHRFQKCFLEVEISKFLSYMKAQSCFTFFSGISYLNGSQQSQWIKINRNIINVFSSHYYYYWFNFKNFNWQQIKNEEARSRNF